MLMKLPFKAESAQLATIWINTGQLTNIRIGPSSDGKCVVRVFLADGIAYVGTCEPRQADLFVDELRLLTASGGA